MASLALLAGSVLVAGAGCGGSGGGGGSGPVFPTVDPLRWSATPATLAFETVLPGTTKTLSVTIRNVSTATAGSLTSAVMPGAEFTLVGATFPVSLAPGQSAQFDVRYAPADTDADAGTVRFLEAAGGPEARVPVTAGAQPPTETEEVTDFGPVSLFGGATLPLQVDVPADAISLAVEAEMAGGMIGILDWSGPGNRVYENASSTGEYVWAPGFDVACFGIPNTDRAAVQLVPGGGTYTFRLKSMNGGGTSMRVRAIVERRDPGMETLGRLDLNVWLANGLVPSAATAATDARLQAVLAEISDILSQQGLTVGDVDYYDVVNPAYDHVSEAEFPSMLTLTTAAAEERLNLFFVVTAIGGGVVGVSPAVGGPKANGTTASGVMSVYDSGFSTGLIGLIAAHEIGHYLGLQHTAEQNGGHDYVDDTEECPGTGTSAACPDEGGGYLMHWQAVGGTDVTDGQGLVVRGHPCTRAVLPGFPLTAGDPPAVLKLRGGVHPPLDAHLLQPGWCGTCGTCVTGGKQAAR
jgi:hypothetical protein